MQAGASKKQVDWGKEEVFFESAPHRGDLAVNIALGATLVWLPLSIAAIGRGAFVKYRFTDKRISVITSAPWKSELSTMGSPDSTQQMYQQALPLCMLDRLDILRARRNESCLFDRRRAA